MKKVLNLVGKIRLWIWWNILIGRKRRQEWERYMDELFSLLPAYGRRATTFSEGAPGSVEWLRKIGDFWQGARKGVGITQEELAERMGVTSTKLQFLELGTEPPTTNLLRRLAEALGNPTLYDEFLQKFGGNRAG